jgi:hypothetical protein
MGKRGPKPGAQPKVPGSGRKLGTPNKATQEIRAELAEIRQKTGRTSQGTMAYGMNYFMDLHERCLEAARMDAGAEAVNEALHKAQQYLRDALAVAKDLGPYEAPRLSAVKVGGGTVPPGLTVHVVNFKEEDCIPTRPLKEIEHETKLIE